jgi:2-keto-4-pentenoate hydratase/2-oxohepta-3-ene-1,7-dioic acid hydratase in catechol pathway
MKFVTFLQGGAEAAGLWLEGERVLDLAAAARLAGEALDASSVLALVRGGEAALGACRRLEARAGELGAALRPAAEAPLLAPIPRPAKNVVCVGRNYLDHVKEGNAMRGVMPSDLPTVPNFFTKPPTAMVGPGAQVRYPAKLTKAFDYEVELGVIIGKDGRDIPAERAFDHVFGYTVINDVTARDLQRAHVQWFKGKGLDTSCPMGPWIVDKAEIGDPGGLELTFHLNGEERQRATADMMIFDIPAIIASLSAGMTLEAGDIIATGTPAGVGYAMSPPSLLKGGDVMTCEISRIGQLINTVVEV